MDVQTLWFGKPTHDTGSAKEAGKRIAAEIKERAPHYATMKEAARITVEELAGHEARKRGEGMEWQIDAECSAHDALGLWDI